MNSACLRMRKSRCIASSCWWVRRWLPRACLPNGVDAVVLLPDVFALPKLLGLPGPPNNFRSRAVRMRKRGSSDPKTPQMMFASLATKAFGRTKVGPSSCDSLKFIDSPLMLLLLRFIFAVAVVAALFLPANIGSEKNRPKNPSDLFAAGAGFTVACEAAA